MLHDVEQAKSVGFYATLLVLELRLGGHGARDIHHAADVARGALIALFER